VGRFFFGSLNLAPEINVLRRVSMSTASHNLNFSFVLLHLKIMTIGKKKRNKQPYK